MFFSLERIFSPLALSCIPLGHYPHYHISKWIFF